MDQPDYLECFRAYADAYERSLIGPVDSDAIRRFFAEAFIAAGTNGPVVCGSNDEAFAKRLRDQYSFLRAIGTTRMTVDRVEAGEIYEDHDQVRVFYQAGYEKKDGTALQIDFDLVYLMQRRKDGPKIFAFVGGDETALYRQHGLIDEQGTPASGP